MAAVAATAPTVANDELIRRLVALEMLNFTGVLSRFSVTPMAAVSTASGAANLPRPQAVVKQASPPAAAVPDSARSVDSTQTADAPMVRADLANNSAGPPATPLQPPQAVPGGSQALRHPLSPSHVRGDATAPASAASPCASKPVESVSSFTVPPAHAASSHTDDAAIVSGETVSQQQQQAAGSSSVPLQQHVPTTHCPCARDSLLQSLYRRARGLQEQLL